jgi:hypothetical protein
MWETVNYMMARMMRAVTQIEMAMMAMMVMMAPTLLLSSRIDLLVITSTRHKGLFKKYAPQDKYLKILPILLKMRTSMAGEKMHKDLLSLFSLNHYFEM